MRVSMEDLCDDLDNVLMEAIALWRNSTKFRCLFHIHRDTFRSVFLLKMKMILRILTLTIDAFHFCIEYGMLDYSFIMVWPQI